MENNWKLLRLGVVVKDMEKAVKYFADIGADVSQPAHPHDGKNFPNEEVFGKPVTPETNVILKMIQLGPLQIELMQPAGGKTAHSEFLKKRGPGVILTAFGVDDLAAESAKLVSKGAKITLHAKMPNGRELAYFDPGEAGSNFIIELIQTKQ